MNGYGDTNSTDVTHPKESVNIKQYREEYREADEFARKVANYSHEVSIPANNELRYAGHHLLLAISDNGKVENMDELQRAIAHCQRAKYEAGEAGIISALERIKLFQDDYRRTVIMDVVHDYARIKRKAKSAQNLLERSRRSSDGVSSYEQFVKMFKCISEMAGNLDDMRDEMNKKVRKERSEYTRWLAQWITATVLGIAGIVAALMYI